MNRKIRAVGFDLGDTLIYYRDIPMSWVALYRKVLKSVADRCQASPTDAQFAEAEQILTRNNTRVTPRTHEVRAEDIFSSILGSWKVDSKQHLRGAMDAYFTFFQQQMCAYPETIEVLTMLRKRGMPIGILTDVPYGMPREFVERDITGAGIEGLFDVLVTSVEVGVRKPEPAGYVALATELNVSPGEMLYIGNEPKDVIGAGRAGMTSVFLDRSNSGANHGQHFIVSTLIGLYDILTDNVS